MGISIWQLLIVLALVLLIFGTKKLKNMGGDLGSAIKGFKSAMKSGTDDEGVEKELDKEGNVIEGEVTSKNKDKDKV